MWLRQQHRLQEKKLLDQVPNVVSQELRVSPLLPLTVTNGVEGATSVGASLGSTTDGNNGLQRDAHSDESEMTGTSPSSLTATTDWIWMSHPQ